jgi:hypothetical protein
VKVSGNCPVQGYEIRDGWLLYFRARDSWGLWAWAPGKWVESGMRTYCTAAEASVTDTHDLLREPDVGEQHEGDGGFPEWPDDENAYPGWWSAEYASAVAEWAIAKVMKGAAP